MFGEKGKMMKKIYRRLFLVAVILMTVAAKVNVQGAESIIIDEKHFPDSIFREYVSAEFDVNEDGYLSINEIGNVKEIDVNGTGIKDMTGIKYLTELKSLACGENELTSLNIRANKKLETLYCQSNKIKELDISNNTELAYLFCGNNQLRSIDISKNTKLRYMECAYNNLEWIEVESISLKYFDCSENCLVTYDFSRIKADSFVADNQREPMRSEKESDSSGKKTIYSIVRTKEIVSMKTIVKVALLVVLGIAAFCIGEWYGRSSSIKGGEGNGMFEKNSEKITISINGEKIVELTGDERKEMVSHLERLSPVEVYEGKFDESYNIKIDCNNEWGVLYLRESDSTCFTQKKDTMYKFEKEDYEYILQVICRQ